jgi:glycolate oxidase
MQNNQYQKVNDAIIQQLKSIVGSDNVITDPLVINDYGRDYTEDLFFPPECVVKPETAEKVAELLKFCNDHHLPVTPRGAGTGLSGGSLPVFKGISLSLEKLNKIVEIDENNFQVTVQSGVINQVLRNVLESRGLFYPPDPASMGSCFLGGNIAHSSGGPRAVKYGTTKDYVLNLRVALATGELIWTAANTLKNSTGYNLTQLMIGSEGTLGVVTDIVFRIIALPKSRLLLWCGFPDAKRACACIPQVFLSGLQPSAIEFMERKAVELSLEKKNIHFKLNSDMEAFLLIELDGENQEALMQDIEKLYEILLSHGSDEPILAETSEQQEKLWQIRRSIGEVVKQHSIYKEEDTVVKRYLLPELYEGIKMLEKKYGFESISYGHAGDGNLHVNILKNNLTDKAWNEEIPKAIRELFTLCKALGGTISGEHGIGLVQKPYMDIVLDPIHFELMKGIKNTFDPNHILNPGKIFD